MANREDIEDILGPSLLSSQKDHLFVRESNVICRLFYVSDTGDETHPDILRHTQDLLSSVQKVRLVGTARSPRKDTAGGEGKKGIKASPTKDSFHYGGLLMTLPKCSLHMLELALPSVEPFLRALAQSHLLSSQLISLDDAIDPIFDNWYHIDVNSPPSDLPPLDSSFDPVAVFVDVYRSFAQIAALAAADSRVLGKIKVHHPKLIPIDTGVRLALMSEAIPTISEALQTLIDPQDCGRTVTELGLPRPRVM